MIIAALIVAGLCLGSFVSALVFRLYMQADGGKRKKAKLKSNDLSIVHGRSVCSHCGHALAPKDLVPVLSWLMLRGKCRYCHKKIADTPLPEVSLAVLFVVSYLFWPLEFDVSGTINFVAWLVLLTGFLALFIYDLRWMLLPNRVVYPLIALAAALAMYNLIAGGELSGLWRLLVGVGVSGGIFYILFQISGGKWIGGGDVKLGLLIGLLLADPYKAFLMLFLASLFGTVFVLPSLVLKNLKPTSRVPFGPFLLLATFVVVLFGAGMIDWYKDLVVIGATIFS